MDSWGFTEQDVFCADFVNLSRKLQLALSISPKAVVVCARKTYRLSDFKPDDCAAVRCCSSAARLLFNVASAGPQQDAVNGSGAQQTFKERTLVKRCRKNLCLETIRSPNQLLQLAKRDHCLDPRVHELLRDASLVSELSR